VLTLFDAGSMEFSHVPLPGELNHLSSYAVGDTEDGLLGTLYHQDNTDNPLDATI
jgi:hypothetical protein